MQELVRWITEGSASAVDIGDVQGVVREYSYVARRR